MFLVRKVCPVRKDDSLTAIGEPIVYTICDPQYPTTL
jgi:hypothetical protein